MEAEAKAEIIRLEKIREVAPYHSVLYDQSHEFPASVTEQPTQHVTNARMRVPAINSTNPLDSLLPKQLSDMTQDELQGMIF